MPVSPLTRDQAIAQARQDQRTQRRGGMRPTRRAQRVRPWPFPNDTATDRARTLANALYEELEALDPERAHRARDRAHSYGERWLGPQKAPDSPRLTRAEVAELAGVAPDTVSQWTTRGRITRQADGRYLERDVHELLAQSKARTRTTQEEA